ncbi:MAG: HAD family phosphatase [bacterium]|nr:HAD family phosphatase [bacterium]
MNDDTNKKIEAVILDMDGLMIDSEVIFLEALKKSSATFGHDMESDFFLCCIGRTDADTKKMIQEEFGSDFPVENMYMKTKEIFNQMRRAGQIKKKKGLMALVHFLQSNNIPRAIASSSEKNVIADNLKLQGLEDAFLHFVGGDQVLRGKPDPEIYLAAASLIDFEPSSCVVLEDSEPGIRAANAAGMTTILIPDIVKPSDEIQQIANIVLPSLIEATSHLKRVLKLS